MKSLLGLLILLIYSQILLGQAEPYHPLNFEQQPIWIEAFLTTQNGEESWIQSDLRILGDSLSDGQNHFVLGYKDEDYSGLSDYLNAGLIREDDAKKVYFKPNTNYWCDGVENQDYLLYDFGIEPGDSTLVFGANITTGEFSEEWLFLQYITQIYVAGVQRDLYVFYNDLDEDWPPVVWLEGIGSLAGLLNPNGTKENACRPLSIPSTNSLLTCYTGTEGFYTNEFADLLEGIEIGGDCSVALSVAEEENNTLNLFPNPAQGLLNIQPPIDGAQIEDLSIYNSHGAIVRNKWIQTSNTIDVAHLSQGFYQCVVRFDNGQIASASFIKL